MQQLEEKELLENINEIYDSNFEKRRLKFVDDDRARESRKTPEKYLTAADRVEVEYAFINKWNISGQNLNHKQIKMFSF